MSELQFGAMQSSVQVHTRLHKGLRVHLRFRVCVLAVHGRRNDLKNRVEIRPVIFAPAGTG